MSITKDSVPAASVACLPQAHHLTSLLEQMARGDRDAAVTFYDLTSSAVFGLASIVSTDSAAAEALTCRVYVDVWTRAPAFSASGTTAAGWLATVVGHHMHRAAKTSTKATTSR